MRFVVLHPKFDAFTPPTRCHHTAPSPRLHTKKAHLNRWASRFKDVGLLFQSHFFLILIERIVNRKLINSQLLADSAIANYFSVFIKSTA